MKRLAWFLAGLCAALTLSSCALAHPPQTMTVTFFNVGAADAILLKTPASTVLVDTGLKKNDDALISLLRSAGVEKLDVLLITHYDKDHVGGAPKVLETFPVGRILHPDYVKDAKPYERYQEALKKTDAEILTLSADMQFTLDGAEYAVSVAPRSDYRENDLSNNFSLVTTVRWGGTSFLLAGDAERERLDDLLRQGVSPCTVLKVPHHGRIEDNSEAFFAAAAPRFAVITSDAEEPEDAGVLTLLKSAGAEVFLTREGTVQFVTDGEALSVSQQR